VTTYNTQKDALRTRWKDATVRLVNVMMGARTAGTPLANDPARQENYPSRPPIGYPITIPRQNMANGRMSRQAGFGRPILPVGVAIAPNQSLTRMPDGRIIARPMPNAAVDARQVIGG
jgi:hypothetical protein